VVAWQRWAPRLFVFSDSLIGIDRFVSPFAAAPYLIILPTGSASGRSLHQSVIAQPIKY
jgi:hypothetical protein